MKQPTAYKNWKGLLGALIGVGVFSPTMAQDQMSMMVSGESKFWILLSMLIFQLILLVSIGGIVKTLTSNSELWKKMLNKKAAGILLFFILGGSEVAFAQGAVSGGESWISDPEIHELLLWLNATVLLAIFIVFAVLRRLMRLVSGQEEKPAESFETLMMKMTDAVPVEEEEDVLTDHEYDGIHELDNNLPPWWVMGFYITIVSGILYLGYYELYLGGDMMEREYTTEMEDAAAQREAFLASLANNIDETNVELLTDATSLSKGKEVFIGRCATCHGQLGEGGAGPNLTDKYWLHGGDVKQIFETIKYGVQGKAMIAWGEQLTPPQMQNLSSYIVSLEGTNPPNGKAPEGELYVPQEIEEIQVESDTVLIDTVLLTD